MLAEMIQKVWHLGMTIYHYPTMRDFSLTFLTYSFNGLHEGSVLSLKSSKVFLQRLSFFARCTICKGRVAYREQLVAYHATS